MAYDYSMMGYSPYGAMAPETFSQITSPYAIPRMGVTTAVPASEVGLLAPNTNARVRPTVDPSLDMSLLGGQQGYQFVTNKGKPAKTKEGASGFVPLIPDAQYRLVNKRGRDAVAASGVGQQGLQDVYATAQRLSAEGGKKAQWEVEMLDPATGTWSQVARDPKGGLGALGTVMDIGLPIAGSLLLPGLGTGLGAALAGGLGAAAGAATSGIIQGKSLENIALQAALSGGLSFAGGELLGQASGGLGSGATEATQAAASEATQGILSEAVKQAAQQALGDVIIVPGIREAATSVLPAAIGAGLGGAGASALTNLASSAPRGAEGDIIDVIGERPLPNPPTPNLSGILPAVAATPAAIAATQGMQAPDTNRIVVTPNTPPSFTEAFAPFASGVPGAVPSTTPAPLSPDNTIVVEGKRPLPNPPTPNLSGILPAAGATSAAIAAATGGAGAQPEKPTGPNRSTLEEISTWLNRAGMLSSVLGPLAEAVAGGGGGGGNRSINAAGLGGLNPLFNAQLPAANMPAMQPRDMSGTDWNRYAFGPEQSFFTNVPQRLAEGGLAHSDGRSDDVPAMLSRGEYVIDAETMALLGNGDPFAGADKMDEWRVNVRKHKGRQLMKGDISPDAKMPSQYMGGGRV